MTDPDKYLISGTDYLLVEFSDYAISPGIGDALMRFKSMGITPIITHPERNMVMVRRPEQVLRFAEHGCIIQITANSLTGHWGDGAKNSANGCSTAILSMSLQRMHMTHTIVRQLFLRHVTISRRTMMINWLERW